MRFKDMRRGFAAHEKTHVLRGSLLLVVKIFTFFLGGGIDNLSSEKCTLSFGDTPYI